LDKHDAWFFWVAGAFFVLTAKRFGTQLANGLQEPDDPPERVLAYARWNILAWRVVGIASFLWGLWLFVR
jgi:hypothetical protein